MNRAVLVLLGLTSLAHAGDADNSTAAQQAIRKVLDDQVVAWNKRDLPGFMAGYWQSEELTFFSGASKTRGWQATLDRYRKKYQGEGKEMGTLAFKDIDVRLLGPDHALATGRFELQLRSEKASGIFTLILHKKEAGWRIVHDHTSS
jgi:uncharacterized protein (TIGR02246 family)